MKYLHTFKTKYLMDTSIINIKHRDGAFVYGVSDDGEHYSDITITDQRHEGPNCYKITHVNMEPVKLDKSSSKQKPEVADVLYSTVDGKLTLDEQTDEHDNIPIAICVIPEVMENFENGDQSEGAIKTARFVSLNYMSCITPWDGSVNPEKLYIGNYANWFYCQKGTKDNTGSYGGKWNTQKMLTVVKSEGDIICDGIDNSNKAPAASACNTYVTLGTKEGDWYLPSIGEMYQLYTNKNIINAKRSLILGDSYSQNAQIYWTSRENTSYTFWGVDLSDGSYKYVSKATVGYVLGFLALSIG